MWGLGDRTTIWNSPKRPWPMPRLSNTGQRKPSHWCQACLTNWQRVYWSSDESLNLWSCSQMQTFWMTACPPTGSKSHPCRHQSPWIPQLLRNEAAVGAIGLKPEVCLPDPWHRAIKAPSHCLGGKSISLTSPEGRAAARRHCQQMANTPSSICGDHEIPSWGQPTLGSWGCSPWVNRRTEPHKDGGVHNILHPVTARFCVRSHLHWHHDLLHEPCGLGGYPLSSWLLYAHTAGRGGHGFWPHSPLPVAIAHLCWWLFAFHWQLYIFPWLHAELLPFSDCSPLVTLLNCFYLACSPSMFIRSCQVFLVYNKLV